MAQGFVHGKVLRGNTVAVDKKLDIYNHTTDLSNSKSIVNVEAVKKLSLDEGNSGDLHLKLGGSIISTVNIGDLIRSILNENPGLICDVNCNIDGFSIIASSEDLNKGDVSGGGTYYKNQVAILVAASKPGYVFDGWYENNIKLDGISAVYQFVVTSDRVLQARFKKLLRITAISSPVDAGTTLVDGHSSVDIVEGQSVTLTTGANVGFEFLNWTPNIGTSTSVTVTPTNSTLYTAVYESSTKYLTISPSVFNVSKDSAIYSVTISSSSIWTLTNSVYWARLDAVSGVAGETVVQLTIDASTEDARQFTFNIRNNDDIEGTITIIQDSGFVEPSSISISPNIISFTSDGGQNTATVTVSGLSGWTMESLVNPWFTITPTSGAVGDTIITIDAPENTTGSDIEKVFIFSIIGSSNINTTLTVIQQKTPNEIYFVPFEGQCTVDVISHAVPDNGARTYNDAINSSGQWHMVANTIPSWVSFSQTSGPASSCESPIPINVYVQQNNTNSSREAAIRFMLNDGTGDTSSDYCTMYITQPGIPLTVISIGAIVTYHNRISTVDYYRVALVSDKPIPAGVTVCGNARVIMNTGEVVGTEYLCISAGSMESSESSTFETNNISGDYSTCVLGGLTVTGNTDGYSIVNGNECESNAT